MLSQAKVTDATLREGMQTIAGTFSVKQSVVVAQKLVESGVVDIIECGHPSIGAHEARRVRAVVNAVGGMKVMSHARLRFEDIQAVADVGAEWVGCFLGINDVSRMYRTGWKDFRRTLEQVRNTIDFAHDAGLKMRFTVEDATRTSWTEICQVVDVAVQAGVERICLADSTGYREPNEIHELFSAATARWTRTELEGHFHDDRGLAMSNALAAVDAGATSISTSVNGLGERAGITDLATFTINQFLRSGVELPEPEALDDLTRLVSAYSRSHPDERRPFVGANVFHHASRLHSRAVKEEPKSYEIIDPKRLGRVRSFGTYPAPRHLSRLVVKPPVISATELKHHRHGPGERYVLVDDRFVTGAGQYCIARRIPSGPHDTASHVDVHAHKCDSLFGFLGDGDGFEGLTVEVTVGEDTMVLDSPAAVFIPAGEPHTYRPIQGGGTYINHVLSGTYNESLL